MARIIFFHELWGPLILVVYIVCVVFRQIKALQKQNIEFTKQAYLGLVLSHLLPHNPHKKYSELLLDFLHLTTGLKSLNIRLKKLKGGEFEQRSSAFTSQRKM